MYSSLKFSAVLSLTVILSVCAYAIASAQSGGTLQGSAAVGVYTPERGSIERKAIVDALRVPVEKQLKQKVIFKIDHLKLQTNWAFIRAVPQQPDGSAIDYQGTVYQEAKDAGAFDDEVIALLHNVNGRWRVVQYVIGATDVPYVYWDTKYHAPAAIFR